MSVRILIPSPLRRLTGGDGEVRAQGGTLSETINDLERQFPGLRDRICDEAGEIRRFVNIYVNGEDVRFLQGIATPLKADDELSIVPAVAGG